jgi:hypothetical protein
MAMRRQLTGMLLVSAVSLGLAAPALAAPADEEYLPKVPKAAGDEVVAGEGKGSTILSPKARGAKEGEDDDEDGSDETSLAGGSDDDSGPADTLLDPIVLLLIAGVVAAAVGMMLKRRRGSEDSTEGDSPTRPEPTDSPRPPDGQILGGGEPQK